VLQYGSWLLLCVEWCGELAVSWGSPGMGLGHEELALLQLDWLDSTAGGVRLGPTFSSWRARLLRTVSVN
jgi:hypothetical protein